MEVLGIEMSHKNGMSCENRQAVPISLNIGQSLNDLPGRREPSAYSDFMAQNSGYWMKYSYDMIKNEMDFEKSLNVQGR